MLAHNLNLDIEAFAAAKAKELNSDVEFYGLRRDDTDSILVKATIGTVTAATGVQSTSQTWNFGSVTATILTEETLGALT